MPILSNSVIAAAMLLATTSPIPAEPEQVSAELQATKTAYLQGEPIELRLSITNTTRWPVTIEVAYPTFEHNSAGIKLAILNPASRNHQWRGNLDAEPTLQSPVVITIGGGKVPSVRLGAGATWFTNVYLQRYLEQLPLGTTDITYSVEIACTQAEQSHCAARGQGKIRATLITAREHELAEVMASYAQRLKSDDH